LDRVIGHIDLDYFYAQVEEVEDPTIKDHPVIVCVFSGRTSESGVVSAANYRARELGVHSGMPIVLAKKKLQGTDPVIIKVDHAKYEAVSDRIMETLGGWVDILEQTSIDESFFEVTASTGGDYGAARRIATEIKETILHDEHLTCSIGIGRSKAVSKLASDSAKPGGLIVVLPEATGAFLSPLPVTRLYGVGPRTDSILASMSIRTIGELSRADPEQLERSLGKKLSAYLLAASAGRDEDRVVAGLGPTQYSRIITLKQDTRDPQQVLGQLADGVDYIETKLKANNKSFRTLTAIGILTDLTTHTKSKTFDAPVSDVAAIRRSAPDMFKDLSGSVQKDFRRVGLRVSGLNDEGDQKSLSEYLRPEGLSYE
jgi:DNA polymerase IV (archaeal DinB-like DNA polymerase)